MVIVPPQLTVWFGPAFAQQVITGGFICAFVTVANKSNDAAPRNMQQVLLICFSFFILFCFTKLICFWFQLCLSNNLVIHQTVFLFLCHKFILFIFSLHCRQSSRRIFPSFFILCFSFMDETSK